MCVYTGGYERICVWGGEQKSYRENVCVCVYA